MVAMQSYSGVGAINAVPTPNPPQGVNYTPQSPAGGYDLYAGAYSPANSQSNVLGATTPAYDFSQAKSTPTTTTPTTTTGNNNNGGSSGNSNQGLIDQYKARGWTDLNAINADIAKGGYRSWQNGGSGPDYGAVNDAFNGANGALDTWQQQLNANEPNIESGIASQYDALQPGMQTAYQAGVTQNQSNTQNAIDAAKQMYQQMSTGANQLYGGANSAGQFAQQFYGKQAMQNLGNIQNTSNTNASNAYSTYQDNISQLNQAKQTAISQAQQQFQQNLNNINSGRVQIQGDKANALLGELQNYRSRIYQIQDAADQYARQMQSQIMQDVAQVQSQAAYKTGNNQFTIPQSYYSAIQPYQTSNVVAPTITGNNNNQKNPNNPFQQ